MISLQEGVSTLTTGTTEDNIKKIQSFASILNEQFPHLRVLTRWSKGEDIDAACGQLATNNEQ